VEYFKNSCYTIDRKRKNMAFLDYVKLNVKAGKGGSGVVRWRHERSVAYGGPWGGNGGRGGDVYIVGKRNLHTLHNYANQTDFHAADGEEGGNKLKQGAKGKDLTLEFPLGTEIYVQEYDKKIDITKEDVPTLLFRGGDFGFGNDHFKSSVNRSPETATDGKPGEWGTLQVNLKFIADVGLIGFPNAGKSSLLNFLTNANSKVGNYKFTTLEPHLGDYHGYILADIPGLIEGASEGRGLGHKFLKHIERTGILVHMIDAGEKDYTKAYKTIREELGKYNSELLKKKEILVISKLDNLGVSLDLLIGRKTKKIKTETPKFKILSESKIKKLSKDEKLLYKLELAEFKKQKKDVETKAKLEKLVLKTFKTNIQKLEKIAKKKTLLLSLYDDKSLKGFEVTLRKFLK
jgi:GTP-binding protein